MALSPKQVAVKAIFPHLAKMIAAATADVEGLVEGRSASKPLKIAKAKEQVQKICAPFVAKIEKLAGQSITADGADF